jgi:hypothetical protein
VIKDELESIIDPKRRLAVDKGLFLWVSLTVNSKYGGDN